MELEFQRFESEHYAEYASWFVDAVLNRYLGPMDDEWLEATLSGPESAGVTWAVFRGKEMVAVIETVFDPENHLPAAITALATKPSLRRQGIASTALQQILELHQNKGIAAHLTYIHKDNLAAQRCAQKVGFIRSVTPPSELDMLEFRHNR
jgi:RimJ/RimL family protein N-acetyltransferase